MITSGAGQFLRPFLMGLMKLCEAALTCAKETQ